MMHSLVNGSNPMDQKTDADGLKFERGSMSWRNAHIQLSEHPTGRNQALARHNLLPGKTIVRDIALAVALLPDEKGSRCDACFRRSLSLKRCSGCVEYWYCGMDCQSRHWKAVHRYMCKTIAKFRTTNDFQASAVRRQTDAFLLSHLIAEHGHRLSGSEDISSEDLNDPLATFASLLPLSVNSHEQLPAICSIGRASSVPPAMLKALFIRFSNNNFIIHSHLVPVGHGIFPLASRLFNHSCIPNAIVTYAFRPDGVQMTVKILTEIKTGDEITIPYFDPALPLRRRQEICRHSYGFECVCSNCTFCKSLGDIPKPPTESTQSMMIEDLLLNHVFPELNPTWPSRPLLFSLPAELNIILHEDFLPSLSKTFSDAAHDGPYSLALRSGLVLFALYVVIYPSHFPQIGVHCLEMAKTAWNASIKEQATDGVDEAELLRTARQFLSLATDSLSVMGKEGDAEDEPLAECTTLAELLNSA